MPPLKPGRSRLLAMLMMSAGTTALHAAPPVAPVAVQQRAVAASQPGVGTGTDLVAPSGGLSRAAGSGARVAPSDEHALEIVRQRLADKLGAQTPVAAEPYDLRVQTRAKPSATASSAVARAATQPAAHPATNHGLAPVALRALEKHKAAAGMAHGEVHTHGARWSYEGETGPQAWAQLDPQWVACGAGTRQSPIDVRDGIAVQLEPLRFDYRPGAFRVIDNGHTVQVNVAGGNWMSVMGRRFELQQFHFHRPSEERIAGRHYDMSAHLVHRDEEGRLAVLAVMLERGGSQPVVQMVWNHLPLEKHEELAAPVALDPSQLLPDDRRYFTYMGSLTTPPCSEGVLWMVLKKPVAMSSEQLAIFSRLYPMNARPLQAASGRLIKESE